MEKEAAFSWKRNSILDGEMSKDARSRIRKNLSRRAAAKGRYLYRRRHRTRRHVSGHAEGRSDPVEWGVGQITAAAYRQGRLKMRELH